MQAIRCPYENEWYTRSNLNTWRTSDDDGRSMTVTQHQGNIKSSQGNQWRIQSKITNWLVYNADDEG